MGNNDIITDINEGVQVLETYKLECLMWRFEDCPLIEIKHYVPKGYEELVILCHKENKYIPFRMVFEPNDDAFPSDTERNYIQMTFHSEYHLFIVLGPTKQLDS